MYVGVVGAVAILLAGPGPVTPSWRSPTPREANQDWRSHSPNRYLVAKGDFDGDGTIDEAALLIRADKPIAALVVHLGGRNAPDVLEELGEIAWLEVMGIDLVPAGTYPTACGKGYWTCEPGEPSRLSLERPAIDLFKEGSAESYFFYDKLTRAFRRVWMSD